MSRCTRTVVCLVVSSASMALTSGVAVANDDFQIHGAVLTHQPDGSWAGPGKLDGRTGRLTVTGPVDLASNAEPHKLDFKWKAGKRLVSGCSVTQILQRPHGVMLWDGLGRITRTSRKERKYRGLHISLTGPTKAGDLDHAKLTAGSYKPSSIFPAVNC